MICEFENKGQHEPRTYALGLHVRLCHHNSHVAELPVGDEHLGAIEDPLVSITHGPS